MPGSWLIELLSIISVGKSRDFVEFCARTFETFAELYVTSSIYFSELACNCNCCSWLSFNWHWVMCLLLSKNVVFFESQKLRNSFKKSSWQTPTQAWLYPVSAFCGILDIDSLLSMVKGLLSRACRSKMIVCARHSLGRFSRFWWQIGFLRKAWHGSSWSRCGCAFTAHRASTQFYG